jgi:hypothetical protein
MQDARGESIGVILAQVSPGPNSVKCAEALTEYVFHNLRISAPAPGRPNTNLSQLDTADHNFLGSNRTEAVTATSVEGDRSRWLRRAA